MATDVMTARRRPPAQAGQRPPAIRNQLICAWCGPLFIVLFGIGFAVIAKFVPPPSPASSAQEIADFYAENTDRIRLGLLITMASSALLVPWVAAIAIQMRRIEGASPVLAYTQLAAGSLVVLEIIFPVMFWTAAAFRPGRDPQLILLLNDIGWLPFVMAWAPPLVHNLAIGLAVLSDRSAEPVFPRWAGPLNIVLGVALVPGALITFFKTGPLAWDGAIGWWLTIALFFVFWTVMSVLLFRAIRRQAAEEGQARM